MVNRNPEFCKIENALEVLVGKWKPIILLYLMEEETVEYSITEYGKTLNGILEAMHEWGVRHQERMSGKLGK